MNTIETARKSADIPWYIWAATAAVTSAIIGIQWDISWHRSIGRDTFLTPAHVAIYLCGILAGVCCGYLILAATFTKSDLRAASIKVWGFRGPLGAFVGAWGGFVMLTSAPFDDWWHGAYGLDVKILSPPHVVLALGIFAIEAGAVLLVAGQRNRAPEGQRGLLNLLFLYVGAMGLLLLMAVSMEYSWLSMQHSALFFEAVCMTVPFIFALVWQASGARLAASAVAGFYMLFMMAFVWILPIFAAEPKLGPVYHQVTRFVPPAFPLLLIVPAIALDLLWARIPHWGAWRKALISGPVFLVTFAAAQWPFANFLQSPAARNAFFGSDYFDYLTSPNSLSFRHLFYPMEHTPKEFWSCVLFAIAWSILGIRLGLARGNWIRGIQR